MTPGFLKGGWGRKKVPYSTVVFTSNLPAKVGSWFLALPGHSRVHGTSGVSKYVHSMWVSLWFLRCFLNNLILTEWSQFWTLVTAPRQSNRKALAGTVVTCSKCLWSSFSWPSVSSSVRPFSRPCLSWLNTYSDCSDRRAAICEEACEFRIYYGITYKQPVKLFQNNN